MILHYNFDGCDYEKEVKLKKLRELFADFYAEEYELTDEQRCTIIDFIDNCDLEDTLCEFYEEALHEYFYNEMHQRYLDDCADEEYWETEDIHGGV